MILYTYMYCVCIFSLYRESSDIILGDILHFLDGTVTNEFCYVLPLSLSEPYILVRLILVATHILVLAWDITGQLRFFGKSSGRGHILRNLQWRVYRRWKNARRKKAIKKFNAFGWDCVFLHRESAKKSETKRALGEPTNQDSK
jgi:hypothetical protein